MSNLQTVQSIYEAFGRGDIGAILSHLADEVIWEYDKIGSDIPWLEQRHGRAEVPKFFEALGALEFQEFRPKTLLENGDIVVALNNVTFTVKTTGKKVIEEDEVHIWYFDSHGRVNRFCHKTDTRQHWLALQGS